jgi:uncharacterized protein YlzI (FlbEa/FlbD family)
MKDLHRKIVDEILPRLASKLKKEGIILDHDNEQIKIKNLPKIRINPDRILHLSNGKNILVEIVNPEESKRFIGELVYAKILIQFQRITAALFLVLNPEKQGRHERSLSQIHALSFLHLPKGSRIVTCPDEEDRVYRTLKAFAERFKT